MPSEENKYSPEFKKKVAQEALDNSKKNLDGLSNKYDVPVSVILMWTAEFEKGGEEVFQEEEQSAKAQQASNMEDIEVQGHDNIDAVSHGVMPDNLNYKRLIFWALTGMAIIIIVVQSLMMMFDINKRFLQFNTNEEDEAFYQSVQQKKKAKERINSFGVVDLDEGIYRVPVDSIIDEMAADTSSE